MFAQGDMEKQISRTNKNIEFTTSSEVLLEVHNFPTKLSRILVIGLIGNQEQVCCAFKKNRCAGFFRTRHRCLNVAATL